MSDHPVYDAAVQRARLPIMLAIAAFARAADAAPCEDTSALRADLQQESVRIDHWTLAWRISYTALAAGELGVAASGALGHDNAVAAWVGGAKSALGALGQWLSPLAIDVPAATPGGDVCADRVALRAAAERAARDESRTFWVSHLGGLIVNLGGAVVVGELVSWRAGLLSFATGYPIGLIATYTMPRASWHRVREPGWTASVVAGDDRRLLVVTGRF